MFCFLSKLDHFLAVVVSAADLVVSLSPPVVYWLGLFLAVVVVSVADSPLLLMTLYDLFSSIQIVNDVGVEK